MEYWMTASKTDISMKVRMEAAISAVLKEKENALTMALKSLSKHTLHLKTNLCPVLIMSFLQTTTTVKK